jgi:hypothetical protein
MRAVPAAAKACLARRFGRISGDPEATDGRGKVRTFRILCAAALAFGAAPAIAAAAPAAQEQATADAAGTDSAARDRATNEALLKALLQRRAEIAQSTREGDKSHALAFLDRQIAKVRKDMGD